MEILKPDKLDKLDELKKLVQEIPTSCSRWESYLNLLHTIESPDYEEQLMEALLKTKFEVSNSDRIWNIYYNHYLSKLDLNDPESIVQLKQLWLDRIQVPHNNLDNTFNSYSSFISTYSNDEYIDEMKKAKNHQKNGKLIIEKLEPWELQIPEKKFDPEFWIDYMSFIFKSRLKIFSFSLKLSLCHAVFYRSVEHLVTALKHPSQNKDVLKESWIQVWKFYITLGIELNPEIFNKKFLDFYKDDHRVWISYLESITTIEQLADVRNSTIDTFKTSKDLVHFYSTLISKEFRLLEQNTDVILEWLITDIEHAYPIAVEINDVFHSLEKLCIEIYESIGNIDDAKTLINQLLEDRNAKTQVEVWLFAIEFEKKNGNHNSLADLFKTSNGLLFQLDWPERLLEEWKRFLLLSGSPEEWTHFNKLFMKFNDSKEEVPEEVDIETQESINDFDQTLKRSREEIEVPVQPLKKQKIKNNKPVVTRDREHLSILVSNLPEDITKIDLEKYFSDCGIIRSIIQDSNIAVLEMSSESEVLAALTKDRKIFKSTEIEVVKLENNIVWTTNFPPEYNAKDLRELFGSCGKVLSTRLPSLRNNTDRRFCYVEFINSKDADVAVSRLNDKNIESNITKKSYKLVVKISNSSQRSNRSGAVEEGRQLYVGRLDYHKATEESLRELFSKYGDVESINIPLTKKNMKMNRKNDGYAFISFKSKDSTVNAINELNGTEFFSREIIVTLSEARPKHSSRNEIRNRNEKVYESKDIINSKTLFLLNLDETVSTSQLMILMKEVGPVRKIELRTDVNAALVEFESLCDCGKAEIKFDKLKIGNKKVDVGSRKKFDNLLKNKKSDQRSEEIVKKAAEISETPIETTTTETTTKAFTETLPKSNEDFRKMFLGF